MNDEQIATLNVTQQVLRGLVMSLLALNRAEIARVADALQAFAHAPGIEPTAANMLKDLAGGVSALSSVGKAKQ